MICVSLVDMDMSTCLSYCTRYPFVELRLDRLAMTPDELRTAVHAAAKSIATCRRQHPDPLTQYMTAIDAGVDYVDLELSDNPDVFESVTAAARKAGIPVIVSVHDYEGTPDDATLAEWLNRAVQTGGDLVKIACKANDIDDNLRLLNLLTENRFPEVPKIVTAMGTEGVLTRVLAPLLGAPFTFAAPDGGTPSAPGQLPAATLHRFLDMLLSKGRW